MYQGSTPTLTFTIKNIENFISEIQDLTILFATSEVKFEKSYSDVTLNTTDNSISVTLSQDETKLFLDDFVEVQLKITTTDNKIIFSKIYKLPVYESLESQKEEEEWTSI